jgi:ABC-type antimicrobial peptide transport system, permease component
MRRRLAEMGVRKAFGATRRTLLNQLISENLLLTLCGGFVGLLITWLLLYVFRSWLFFAVGNTAFTLPEPTVAGEDAVLAPHLRASPWPCASCST